MIDRRASLFARSGLPVPDPHAGALTVGLSSWWRLAREGDLFVVWGHVVAAMDRPRICWLQDLLHGSVRRCISKGRFWCSQEERWLGSLPSSATRCRPVPTEYATALEGQSGTHSDPPWDTRGCDELRQCTASGCVARPVAGPAEGSPAHRAWADRRLMLLPGTKSGPQGCPRYRLTANTASSLGEGVDCETCGVSDPIVINCST